MANDLLAGRAGKIGSIGAICRKNAANISMIKPSGPWAGGGGTARLCFRLKRASMISHLATTGFPSEMGL
jgi:hypothetical protein